MKPDYLISIFFLVATLMTRVVHGQENPLEDYQWKHRILLLITDSDSEGRYQQQISALGELDSDFEDRKLLVVDVRTDKYSIRNRPKMSQMSNLWKTNKTMYSQYGIKGKQFSVVLIGLDGGVKLRQAKVLERDQLFERIDAMPMRSAEIKNKYK